MVGKLLSFWEDLFSEGMFVSGRVYLPLTHHPVNSHHQDCHTFSRGSLVYIYIYGSKVSSTVNGSKHPSSKGLGCYFRFPPNGYAFFGVLKRLVDDFHCHVLTCLCFHPASSLMDFVSTYKGENPGKYHSSLPEVDFEATTHA